MPEISIIIPVYRVEKYLSACLDSVRAQSFSDWECILIDDGSTDGSAALCETYAAQDSRFSVIRQANAGVSSARNRGIAAAKGEFCTFLDADDRLAPDFLSKLRCAMTDEVDLTLCGYRRITPDGEERAQVLYQAHLHASLGECSVFPCTDRSLASLWRCGGLNSIWGKLYRVRLIRERSLCFDSSLSFAEDMRFAVAYANQCSAFAVIDEPLYDYLWREESLTTAPSVGVLEQRYRSLTAIAEELATAGKVEAARAVRDRRDDLTPESFLERMPNRADRIALLKEYCRLPNYREMTEWVKKTRSRLTWAIYWTRSPRILLWALERILRRRQASAAASARTSKEKTV